MQRLRLILALAVLTAAVSFAAQGRWPWPRLQVAAPIVVSQAFVENADTLRPGETLGQLLNRQGLASLDLSRLGREVGLDARRLRAGLVFNFRRPVGDSIPTRVVVRTGPEERLRLDRGADENWDLSREAIEWRDDVIRVTGRIGTSLYDALDGSIGDGTLGRGERVRLAWDLADVFAWNVDFTRDIQVGDEFNVVLERRLSEEGEVRYGRVLATELVVSGKRLSAYRFEAGGQSGYYDATGKSLRRAFLRAPVQFRRITSSPSRARFHPILRTYRRHAGTDYSAAPGTPVMAAGQGTVTKAGWSGGYGILVEIRHANGITTRYGHLRGVASGVRAGARVGQSDLVGYVGSTGLSTGPHLHYEFLVNGVPQDSRRVVGAEGPPIAPSLLPAFQESRSRFDVLLAGPAAPSVQLGD